jgi:hypothetical protein
MDVSTQVSFDNNLIDKLIEENEKLENLRYNTFINSGKIRVTLNDEIQEIIANDELINLRKEFKNQISLNKQLKSKERDCCLFCSIL